MVSMVLFSLSMMALVLSVIPMVGLMLYDDTRKGEWLMKIGFIIFAVSMLLMAAAIGFMTLDIVTLDRMRGQQ